jgi:voltage-gated hydrogen channel 1
MTRSSESRRPLLGDNSQQMEDAELGEDGRPRPRFKDRWNRGRQGAQVLLVSKKKHYVVLGIVALDVAALLTNIFLELIACDTGIKSEPWVADVNDGLKTAGLVFSSLFLVELLLCIVAFGFR